LTAPTSVKGYVDPYALGSNDYASIYLDLLEHVPDLIWPNSIPVYAKMRRDPKLAAILQGWTLNLRRAQWQLDPAGCRPEVVQQVADGMGLAIQGKDEPGPARLRGVSWGDHLAAVLRMIPFGFSAFELEADTSDKKTAKLSGLWERPQWTISHLHVDGKSGLLTGVTQDGAFNDASPQIPARNMAFYVREREGANWAGQSLLRPSYASWLIKEEVRRAFAIANVRWSAGVPVNEALPGTNPTPAQMAEAAQMAQQARAGISAGGSTPPGFTLKILGITGSLPPTQEFLRWLDQQMSASALLGVLELGETPNGSRALGEAFLDSFHLALESEGELVADVATRQIAARIVNWNFGEDEPVPRVVVSGIGSRREVTAESLQMLLSSGALAADPALEEWVRREYRLPERDPDAPVPPVTKAAPVPPGPDGNAGGQPAEPVAVQAAAKPRPRSPRRKTAGQPALFGDDDPAAAAARIQQQWEQAKAALLKKWPKTAQPMVDELADQAEAAVAEQDLEALGSLAVSAGVIAAVALMLNGSGDSLAADAAAGVVTEAANQGVSIDTPDQPGAERVRQVAAAVAGIIAAGYASGAAKAALQLAGAAPSALRAAVADQLADLGAAANGLVGDNVGALLASAQYAGRLAVLEQHPADSYVAVEANDGPSRCEPCKKIDKTVYGTLAEALADYPNAGGTYIRCEGRARCHGHIAPRWT
jgi:hypothetical protein